MNIALILVTVALALGLMAVVEAKGRSLTGWGIVALSLVWLLPLLLAWLLPL